MEQREQLTFGPFRLDLATGELWRGEQVVALQPKPLAVLHYLAQRPGQLVTKLELLKAIWAGTVVTTAVVKECVRVVRNALGEETAAPHYIKTVGREGYRFIGAVVSDQLSVVSPPPATPPDSQLKTGNWQLTTPFVGRETELVQLYQWLDKALRGEPQLVFVTGEPGIGKTTLIEAFLARIAGEHEHELRIGHGQCVEHYGEGEAYLPMLEAMGRLCREAGGQQIIALLRQYAPTWLAQLPGVIPEEELQVLRLQMQGSTQQRMLREMAEAIEVGTVRRPLVLIVEDLHWSDHSTLELLAYLAKRGQRARLLIVATYRPADVVLRAHPLKEVKQELQAHGQCAELRLELLTREDITEYLTRRFPGSALGAGLAQIVYEHTDGNPLFMVSVVEEFLRQGVIVEQAGQWELKGDIARASVPDTLRQLIEKQSAQLREEERHVLEVASVVGTEFAVAAVAAALKQEMDEVETLCEELAWQGHFVGERGIAEWPDGTMSGRYGFRHALYQNVLYDRIAEARRIRLHRLIGERLEAGYGSRAHEIAAELAVHFERGHEYPRAVHYLEQAGKNAVQRSAHREAIVHLTKGLELLKLLSDTPERMQQELALQIALGVPLMATKGYAVMEVEKAYSRARELCQQIGEAPQLFSTLQGLFAFYLMRGDLQAGCELAEQCHSLARSANNPTRRLWAQHGLAQTSYFRGEFALAREHAEQGIALYDAQKRRPPASGAVQDPGVACRSFAAFALWFLGYPDQAWQRCQDALAVAHELSHPLSLAFALSYTASIHNFRREPERAQSHTGALILLCREHEFPFWLAWGMVMQGWSLAEQGQVGEGIAQIQEGLATCRATGADMWRPWFLTIVAAAYEKAGQVEAGLTALAETLAMVEKNGEQLREAELYRLKGELTLQQENQKAKIKGQKSKIKTAPRPLIPDPQSEAEACFLKAIEIARRQQAKSLELRATMSLARLRQQQASEQGAGSKEQRAGNRKQGARAGLDVARNMLSEIYHWFTEGFETKDLQEAKALLEELNH